MKQQRLKTRAPHGSPHFTEKVAGWVTIAQRRKLKRHGGISIGLRKAIDALPDKVGG